MFKDLKKVLNDYKVVSYFIYIVFFGIFYGSISLYLIWYVIKYTIVFTSFFLTVSKCFQASRGIGHQVSSGKIFLDKNNSGYLNCH